MVVQEASPRLTLAAVTRSSFTNSAHILLDGALGNLNIQLQQFTTDAFGSPQPVILRHLLDQRDGFGCEFRLAPIVDRTRLVFPEEPEASPMPAQQGIGLHNQERILPSA